jgi:hypothetical protein
MRAEAQRDGAVPVMVHLEAVPLSAVKSDREGVQTRVRAKAERLFDELGAEAWSAGRWENTLGQAGAYVSAKGLDILSRTPNAVSFFPGKSWISRTAISSADGALVALDNEVLRRGSVAVEVTLNVEGMEVAVRADGSRAFDVDTTLLAAAALQARALVASMSESEVGSRDAALNAIESAAGRSDPRLTLRVNRQGLIKLAGSAVVRGLRPVGHVDRRARHVDASALERASRDGTADVLLVLRDAGMGGKLSAATVQSAKRANAATFDDMLAAFRPVTTITDFPEFGTRHVRLTRSQLDRLVSSADSRLLAIVDNKPIATTQLNVSGPTMNMASAWTAGYRGGGQNVVVIDSGVQAAHPFLAGRVVYEACFGSTQVDAGVQYVSRCPQADAAGDSPPGLAGSAAPVFNCSTVNPVACHHGTHVAGISGGRLAPNQNAGFQGTAPDAGVVAMQVFSFDQAGVREPLAFGADILASLQMAASVIVPNSPASNPYTVNMSLGGGQHFGPCTAAAFLPYQTAIQTLRNAGVAVIVASGNDAFDNAISFPACVQGTIKVAAVANDGAGNARAFFGATQGSNVANPAAFPGETFWLAPGGGNGTFVGSSAAANEYWGMAGTSQAAPQIAGLYADGKSADPALTVDALSAYFVGNASVNVPMTTRLGAPLNFGLRRIQLPAF